MQTPDLSQSWIVRLQPPGMMGVELFSDDRSGCVSVLEALASGLRGCESDEDCADWVKRILDDSEL